MSTCATSLGRPGLPVPPTATHHPPTTYHRQRHLDLLLSSRILGAVTLPRCCRSSDKSIGSLQSAKSVLSGPPLASRSGLFTVPAEALPRISIRRPTLTRACSDLTCPVRALYQRTPGYQTCPAAGSLPYLTRASASTSISTAADGRLPSPFVWKPCRSSLVSCRGRFSFPFATPPQAVTFA